MSTTIHLSALLPLPRGTSSLPRRAPEPATRRADRRPDLERQSITFTIGLYLFICAALLGTHVLAARAVPAEPAPPVTTTAPGDATASGTTIDGTPQDVTP
ncbi:hypothetical protein [Oerskovia merdavium]|uniref:Energy transducer TonB n=1 Tax=Oerskovia merdavium TaxID=2762227 RepID=A0ABR8TXA7_9CELL|nr:hypothetical protein [Oerskovia merdavium]MBD7980424.1 hypothetical protein [Oerskovia merdavium]